MKNGSNLRRKLYLAFSMAAAIGATGCTTLPSTHTKLLSTHSVDQTQNTCNMSPSQAQAVSGTIPVGTSQADVYKALQINNPQTLTTLSSSDISSALYGNTLISVPFQNRQRAQDFYASLLGQSLHCLNVTSNKTFGLTGSQVKSTGKDFTLTMIFQKNGDKGGKLFSKVHVTSNNVDGTSNSGYLAGFGIGGKIKGALSSAL